MLWFLRRESEHRSSALGTTGGTLWVPTPSALQLQTRRQRSHWKRVFAGNLALTKAQSAKLQLQNHKIDVFLTSPLLRSLQTTAELFEGRNIPVVVVPELSEACRFPCDIVRRDSLQQKRQKFKTFDFDRVPEVRFSYTIGQKMIDDFEVLCQK